MVRKVGATGKTKKLTKSKNKAPPSEKFNQEMMRTELSQAKSWLTERTSKVESDIQQLAERLQIRRMLGKSRETRQEGFQQDLDSSLRIEGEGSPSRYTSTSTMAHGAGSNTQTTSATRERSERNSSPSKTKSQLKSTATGKSSISRKGLPGKDRQSNQRSSLALREIARQIKDGGIYDKISSRDLVFKEFTGTNRISFENFDKALEKMHVQLKSEENESQLLESLKRRFKTNPLEDFLDYVSLNEALQNEIENGEYFSKLRQKNKRAGSSDTDKASKKPSRSPNEDQDSKQKKETGSSANEKGHGSTLPGEKLFAEIVKDYMDKFSLSFESAGKRLYAALDKNKNGTLGWSEFKEGIESLGVKVLPSGKIDGKHTKKQMTEADVTKLFAHFDEDSVGVVGQNQFEQHLRTLIKSHRAEEKQPDKDDELPKEDSVWSQTWADCEHVHMLLTELGYATKDNVDSWMERLHVEGSKVLVKDVLDELMVAAGRCSEDLRSQNLKKFQRITQCIDGSIIELAGRLASYAQNSSQPIDRSQLEELFEDMTGDAKELDKEHLKKSAEDLMDTKIEDKVVSWICDNWTNSSSTGKVSKTKFMQYFVLLGGEIVKLARSKLGERTKEELTSKTEKKSHRSSNVYDISDSISVSKCSLSDESSEDGDDNALSDTGLQSAFALSQGSKTKSYKPAFSNSADISKLYETDYPRYNSQMLSTSKSAGSTNSLQALRQSWEWVASGAVGFSTSSSKQQHRETSLIKEDFLRSLLDHLKEEEQHDLKRFTVTCKQIDRNVCDEDCVGLWNCIADAGAIDTPGGPSYLSSSALRRGILELLPKGSKLSQNETKSLVAGNVSQSALFLRSIVQDSIFKRISQGKVSTEHVKSKHSIGKFVIDTSKASLERKNCVTQFLGIFDKRKQLASSKTSKEYRISLAEFESCLQNFILESDHSCESIQNSQLLDAHKMLEGLVDLDLIRDNYSKVAYEQFLVFCLEGLKDLEVYVHDGDSEGNKKESTKKMQHQSASSSGTDSKNPPAGYHGKEFWDKLDKLDKKTRKICKERGVLGSSASTSKSRMSKKLSSQGSKMSAKKSSPGRVTDLDFRQSFDFFDRSNRGFFTLEELHTTLYESNCIEDSPPNPYPPPPVRLVDPSDSEFEEQKNAVVLIHDSKEPNKFVFAPYGEKARPREGAFQLKSGWVGIEVSEDVALVRALFSRIHRTEDKSGTGDVNNALIRFPRGFEESERVRTVYPCIYTVPVAFGKFISWAAPLSIRLSQAKDKISKWLLKQSSKGGGAKDFVRIFKCADKNNDGRLSTKEFRDSVKEVVRELSDDDINAIIEQFDEDGDGSVDFKEFVNVFSAELASLYDEDDK